MHKFGYALITISFLVGAYLVSLDEYSVQWGIYVPFLVVGFVGIALIRISSKKKTHSKETFNENIAVLEDSLSKLISNLKMLDEHKDEFNVYSFHEKIDELLIDDINKFVEARKTISHVYNLQIYADVMSDFAGGERYVNRIWSASVDGYIDEVHEYIGKAVFQFKEAETKLLSAKNDTSNLPGDNLKIVET